jgi:glycosidase
LDNHDKTRFFSTVGEDVDKFKSGIAFLFTMRGIPSMYYGTELLYPGISNPDGKVRQDFQGGWKEDQFNKFTAAGRTAAEKDAFEYVKKLANYRKNTAALHRGKLTHFVPVDGNYVYFRYDDEKTVMVIMNINQDVKKVNTSRFVECMTGFSKAKNIITEEVLPGLETISVGKNSTLVLELMD